MSRHHRESGIALILVIMLMGLLGIILGYLALSCRGMLVQTDVEYHRAVERSLSFSGLAWAKLNLKPGAGSQKPEEQTTELDVNDIAGTEARLTVRIEDGNEATAVIHIQTGSASDSRPIVRSRTFRIRGR